MPELPEVETTLCGVKLHILHNKINNIVIRQGTLRWPIPSHLPNTLKNQVIQAAARRAKYLLFETAIGTLILHLGMSGSLRILTHPIPPGKHDHVDIEFANQKILRYTDPRRFGAILWSENPHQHVLLKNLGVEPLERGFSGKYLHERSRRKKISIKSFLMDNKIVVGVGNIYATESLFAANIDPRIHAEKISRERYEILATQIKKILRQAIKQGGTTLKDFVNSEGKPGYFSLQLKVYGRHELPCVICKSTLKTIRQGQRSTVFCDKCQS